MWINYTTYVNDDKRKTLLVWFDKLFLVPFLFYLQNIVKYGLQVKVVQMKSRQKKP